MQVKPKELPKWAKKINNLMKKKKEEISPPGIKESVSKEPTK